MSLDTRDVNKSSRRYDTNFELLQNLIQAIASLLYNAVKLFKQLFFNQIGLKEVTKIR